MLEVSGIEIFYGASQALFGMSLSVGEGEVVTLMGRNGMGKTTLLKLIHGDLSPESGEIARQADLRVAYLPQGIPLGLDGSVRQVVA